jgi:hypothetical protein
MANTFAPNGFSPIRRVDGASWTGNQSKRQIAAANTKYFRKGDPVVSLNTGYIDLMAAGSAANFAGIFTGCEYLSVAKGYITFSTMFPGGDTTTDVTAYVVDDPNVLFAVQTNNSAGGATAAGRSAIGNTAEIGYATYSNGTYSTGGTAGSSTSGNNQSGISGAYLDQNSFSNAAGSTYPFKIYDIPGVQGSMLGQVTGTAYIAGPGNGMDPNTPFNIVYVTVNAADLRVGQSGI